MRRERLTLYRRARRVEGTCANSEQRARSALSALPPARRYGQGSLHPSGEQRGVGSDPPPGLTIPRARPCGLEAHMLTRVGAEGQSDPWWGVRASCTIFCASRISAARRGGCGGDQHM